jgi:hypothetical protein
MVCGMSTEKHSKRKAFVAVCLLLNPAIALICLRSSTPHNHTVGSLVLALAEIAAVVGYLFAHRAERS